MPDAAARKAVKRAGAGKKSPHPRLEDYRKYAARVQRRGVAARTMAAGFKSLLEGGVVDKLRSKRAKGAAGAGAGGLLPAKRA